MNGAAGEKQEAEKRIKEYIQASSMGLSKKEEQDFKELVIHNEETAKKVFRDLCHIRKRKSGKGVLPEFYLCMAGAGSGQVSGGH